MSASKQKGGRSAGPPSPEAAAETAGRAVGTRGKGGRIYLYALLPCEDARSFGEMGMEGREVYTISFGEISTLVSDTDAEEFDLTEVNVRTHESVLRREMEGHTIIPAEFGTVVIGEGTLRHLLRSAYGPARECLKFLEGKVELGVKAILRRDAPHPGGIGVAEVSDEVLAALKGAAENSASGELFSDRLLINHSFLVRRGDVDAFSRVVEELEGRYSGLRFLYSGPWPPYNFVHIRIGRGGVEFLRKR